MSAKTYEDAMALAAAGDSGGCILGLNKALLGDPLNAAAWNNRGSMLLKLGHPFDAVMNYDYALAVKPNTPEFHSNRGTAFLDMEVFDKAAADFNVAIELRPEFPEALMNQGNLFMKTRETLKAIDSYRLAVKARPDYVDAHLGLAFALMESGNYAEGSIEYEWRWKSEQCPSRGLSVPQWNGERAKWEGEALLFYAEQGHGDALQFMRFAPLIKKVWGGKLYIEVRQPLARLAKSLKGIDGVITFGEQLPVKLSYCLPMMSAMRWMTDFCPQPYLRADSYRASIWHEKLKVLPPGLKIGVCWAGGARPLQPIANAVNKRRSTTFSAFAPLAVPGVSWVSLQVGSEAEQVKTPPAGMTIGDWSDDLSDFFDTAALIECLDLVITVDTAVAHLAAAMGKTVWMLSRYDNCWRWMNDRADSPWYPSLRQFRQPTHGDWASMMQEVRGELLQLVQQRKAA